MPVLWNGCYFVCPIQEPSEKPNRRKALFHPSGHASTLKYVLSRQSRNDSGPGGGPPESAQRAGSLLLRFELCLSRRGVPGKQCELFFLKAHGEDWHAVCITPPNNEVCSEVSCSEEKSQAVTIHT